MTTVARYTNLGELQSPNGEVIEFVFGTWEAQSLNHNTGAAVADSAAASGTAWVGQTGVSTNNSLLTWGPYVTTLQTAHPYRLLYRIKVDKNTSTNEVVGLEVYSSNGTTTYASATTSVKGTDFNSPNVYQWFSVDFNIPAGDAVNVEFYAYYFDQGANVYLDKYVLVDMGGVASNFFEIDSLGNVFLGGELQEIRDTSVSTIAPIGTTNLISGSGYEIGSLSVCKNCTVDTVIHPRTGKRVNALHFHKGYSGANGDGASQTPNLALTSGNSYAISFDAWTLTQTVTMEQDFFPDSLPQQQVSITPTVQTFTWVTSSTDSNWASCAVRFFNDTYSATSGIPDDVYITYVQLEQASHPSPWTPSTRAGGTSLLLGGTVFEHATNAIQFNGTVGSYVSIGQPAILDNALLSSHTIETCIIPSAVPPATSAALSRSGYHHELYTTAQQYFGADIWFVDSQATNANPVSMSVYSTATFTIGQQAVLSLVADDVNKVINFYVNGILQNSTPYPANKVLYSYPGNYNGWLIGTGDMSGQYAYPFLGTVRWSRVWNIALGQSQIASYIAKGALSGTESGLVGYWRSTESGTQVLDRTSNGNNGTIVGSVTRTFV